MNARRIVLPPRRGRHRHRLCLRRRRRRARAQASHTSTPARRAPRSSACRRSCWAEASCGADRRRPRPTDAEGAARAYLHERRAEVPDDAPREVDALDGAATSSDSPDGGAIVRFGNRVDGIEVFREQVNVLVDKRGALVAISGVHERRERAPSARSTARRRHAKRRSARRSPSTVSPPDVADARARAEGGRRLRVVDGRRARAATRRHARGAAAHEARVVPRWAPRSSRRGTSKCR